MIDCSGRDCNLISRNVISITWRIFVCYKAGYRPLIKLFPKFSENDLCERQSILDIESFELYYAREIFYYSKLYANYVYGEG